MTRLSILIVEDEPMIVKLLKSMIYTFLLDVDSIHSTDNVTESISYINEKQPNLILLDVKIKGGSSFDILSNIDLKKIKIIFITSYQEYALAAFKYSAIDYLIKPIHTNDLEKAIKKASEDISKDDIIKINTLNYNIKNNNAKIILNTHDELFIVNVENIIACLSEGSYTKFIIKNGTPILVSKPIKFYNDLLISNPIFYRIHKSYLINMLEIKKVNKKNNTVIMKNELAIPIAIVRWKDFLEKVTL